MDNQKIYFGKRKIKKNKKTPLVQKIFSNVSKNYDLMNDIMSLKTHKIWKKKLVDIINVQTNDKIIDVGSGTGDLVDLIFKKNNNVSIYALDLNKEMLNEAKNNLLDLDKKKNSIIKKFLYKTLSQDFEFNKLQLKINNRIYDSSIYLKKTNKKIWKK